ncbi:hypothetical protein K501DRAFT_252056 [Backusella circina FSU 941]|nr:hypothetical protein K501DRAFT_252056 [Backusella circina FSU 941]
MNHIICENLVSLTEQMNDARGVAGSSSDLNYSNSFADENPNRHADEQADGLSDSHADEHSDSPQDYRINSILEHSSESYTDRVGFMGIIDLTAENVISMLKEVNEYEGIMKASSLNDATLSNHAQEILDAFRNTAPSAKSIRTVLRTYGNPIDFDIFEHADFGFIEITTRHFLDLIESPRNPLLGSLQERTTAIYTTTLLLNQLFLSYNDVLELDWIEKEHCTTKKRKWDGVLVLAKDKRVSISLVEFSGGVKSNNNNSKEKQDISKLYKNMAKVLENLPEASKKQVFAVRFFNDNIYFEKLLYYESKYIRCQHCCIECPTTPRSLLDYIQEVPNLMRWRNAVVNHSLQN